ncbi:bola protein [Lasiosphaeria ovina]|uniref:Bola protein n=1 Tax=Lasiosphaeria ovina TaxID=92902 RepID=A0AAE0K526_9PEZI|nr:bola protein [Lasiosphaeria ovina]
MICQACLRAGQGGLQARARPLSQALLQTTPSKSLSSITFGRTQPLRTAPPAISARSLIRISPPSARPRLFSTSTASASEQVQPQEPAQESNVDLEKPQSLTDGESQVWDRLIAELAPTQLIVQDISGGCGSMYGIEVSSEKFRGQTMLKQQRIVNAAIADLMKEWHGVQLKTRVP